MAITKQQKDEILKELIEKFGKSKSVVFADYRGLDVAGVSDLRGKLREKEAEMKVAKKTLINIAAKENNLELDPSVMEGPVAATFSYEDAMSGLKVLFNFSKENDKLKLLGGVIDGKVVGPDVIQEYAKLPGREELLAKLIGSMNAPVSGTVGLLGNLIAGFVRVLNAYKDTKPAEESAQEEVPKAEEKEEEKEKVEAADTPVEAPKEATEAAESAEAEAEAKSAEAPEEKAEADKEASAE